MILDDEQCYRAAQSRDSRFDGVFITAVKTTGIYCRPSCPAMTPKRRNVEFFVTAAAAQQHGYRACKRCRPDASPGSPEWNVRADVVGRAMRLIAEEEPGIRHAGVRAAIDEAAVGGDDRGVEGEAAVLRRSEAAQAGLAGLSERTVGVGDAGAAAVGHRADAGLRAGDEEDRKGHGQH